MQPLLDRQALATLVAAVLLILISYFTIYSYGNLPHFGTIAINDKIGICLHVAALAMLNWRPVYDIEQETERLRKENALAEREQRQNRALRAGALFLLEPNALHRRFLAYVATELAS